MHVRSFVATRRWALRAGLVATVIGLTFGWSAPVDAQREDGLQVESTTVYVADPDREVIDVSANYTLTNLQSDELIDGSVRSFFYTKWVIAMPATAIDLVASSAGRPLTATVEADPNTDDVVFGTIALPRNLNFQETVQIEVDYTVPGSDPRTTGNVARVNDSFISFSVWAAGTPGSANVRIVIPAGYSVDRQGDIDDLAETVTEAGTVLEATGIQDPRAFFGQIFGRNDSGLLTATATLPDGVATVRAWPDDPEWADFVAEAIEDDIPVIEDLTGLDWPAGDIEVIETVTPYLFGYGGWFNASSGVIEIGDNLERNLILHELGHAWFNDDLIDGRWITEGLAEEFASQTIFVTSGERLDPTPPDLDDPLRVPLAAWASPWTLDEETAFNYELYHYNASWWVIRQITDDIGLEAFAEVLVALDADELPYGGDGPIEQTSQSTRWTHLYDLLEEQTDTDVLDDLFTNYVLSVTEQWRLEPRANSRAEYSDLEAIRPSWSPPLVLRRAMSDWRFDDADYLMGVSRRILTSQQAIDDLATELNLTIDQAAESKYEVAQSRDELLELAESNQDFLADLETLADERDDLIDQAAQANTQVAFDPLTYDDARADLLERNAMLVELADLRAEVAVQAGELGLREPDWSTADGPTDFAATSALAEARLATLRAIDTATTTSAAPRGLLQRIGLIGTDVDSVLRDAQDAFEADDLDQALSATAQLDMLVSGAGTVGRNRVIWAIVLVLIAVTGVWAWRRTRRRSDLGVSP